jgi:uncharacterized protein
LQNKKLRPTGLHKRTHNMNLGIISDTHDKHPAIEKAFAIFSDLKVDHVVHCGDWKLPESIKYVGIKSKEYNIPVKAVFGNRDVLRQEMVEVNKALGAPIEIGEEEIATMGLDGASICIYHGHHKPTLRKLISSQQYDVLCTGHTHKPLIETYGKTLVINPGSTAFRIPRVKNFVPTIAFYSTTSGSAEIVSLS